MSETNNFIIHTHNTPHPHYDIYLQIGKDLKSWIVPNGIPDNTKEKKIAVECGSNDQPLSKIASTKSFEDSYGSGQWKSGMREHLKPRQIKT